MRVTPTTQHRTVLEGLQTTISRVQRAQAELSSGKKINLYSDAPADATSTLRLRAEENDWVSFNKASDDGVAWLNTQDAALQHASALMRRARELAIDGANATSNAASREAMAAEIDGIREELAGVANSSFQGQPVFAGFAGQAVTLVSGTYNWSGDNGAVQRRVSPDLLVQVNGNGQQIFGFTVGQTDAFSTLSQLAANLRSGNTAALSTTDLTHIDAASTNITNGLAATGARTSLIESAKTTGLSQIAVLKDARSSLEDVDIAEAALNMQLAQNGYQAALAAAARLDLPTLADFLR